jgi:hypothetical protein
VDLNVGHEGVVVRVWHPRGAVFFAIPACKAERVRARLLKLVVGIENVAAVILARERDPAVVADVASVVVHVPTVVGRRVRVEVEPVVGTCALVGLVVRVKVHAHPDGHVAGAHVGLVDNHGVVQVVEQRVDA